jgi:hypothetical protein
MQKVEGSSPFSRSLRKPRSSGVFVVRCPVCGVRFIGRFSAGATTRALPDRAFPLDHPPIEVQPRAAATDAVLISATRPTKQLRLRRPDQCRVCSAGLPVGTTAIWDPAARTVTCLICTGSELAARATAPIDPGQPGASALRECQRRHAAREQRARDKLGGVGAFLGRVTDEPSSTRAWQQGANGEVRVGARLEKLLDGTGVRLLHDRRVPGQGQANIDHIAVGPADITVIDAKTHRGRIRRDRDGGVLSERRTILRINGRDQTKLISGVENQIAHVHAALADLDVAQEIDVRGALCFPNVDGLPLFGQIEIRRIIVDGPRRWPYLPHAQLPRCASTTSATPTAPSWSPAASTSSRSGAPWATRT